MSRAVQLVIGGLGVLVVALAIALAISLTQGDEGADPAFAPVTEAPDPAQIQEFQDCVEDRGLEQCRDLLPEGGLPTPGGTPQALPFDAPQ